MDAAIPISFFVLALVLVGTAIILVLGILVVILFTRTRALNVRVAHLADLLQRLDEENRRLRKDHDPGSSAYRE